MDNYPQNIPAEQKQRENRAKWATKEKNTQKYWKIFLHDVGKNSCSQKLLNSPTLSKI